ncbi:Uncharacterised protein [Vibrio cholerae]|nr:Uncharacterised protein [Vibrio cholerae]
MVAGNKQRALTMKALSDDQEIIGIEDFLRAHNRIESTKPRII